MAPEIALTIDIEERHHGLRTQGNDPFFEQDVKWILQLLASTDIQATFFVLGEVARTHPNVVMQIAEAGHEIGLHGTVHEFLRDIGPERFERDLEESLTLITKLAGRPIEGFRAPFFSLTADTRWCLEILARYGFHYDASIYPGPNYRYGWKGAPSTPVIHEPTGLRLFPVPVLHPSFPLAFSGGAYLRILPRWIVDWGLRRQLDDNRPGMIYFHPWETSTTLAWQRDAPLLANITRHLRRHRMRPLLRRILHSYRPVMGTVADVLSQKPNLPLWSGLPAIE